MYATIRKPPCNGMVLKYDLMAEADPTLAADVKARASAFDAKVQILDVEM